MRPLFFLKNINLLFLLFLCFYQINCKKKEIFEDKGQLLLNITSFVFEKKNNPQLDEDIIFNIQGNIISGTLKYQVYELIPTFTTNAQSIDIQGVKQSSGTNKVNFRNSITYSLKSIEGYTKQYAISVSWDNDLPKISINTISNVPITSKTTYLQVTLNIDGNKQFLSFTGAAQVKGRGNSTWTYPKKPYRLKLNTDASLLGLAPQKDWILLANYLDGTHMLNAIAMKIGQLLKMPFTNNIIPVELYVNNQYQGCYMLTEQIEVKKNRVNVGDDGILLLFDKNYDEDCKFKSTAYQIPIMVENPELTTNDDMLKVKQEFEKLESLIANSSFPNNNYLDIFDADVMASFYIVHMLTDNREINHPKSTYMHKAVNGKFTMGPIWDFDWAYGYEQSFTHFKNYNVSLFWSPPSVGTSFFSKIMTDPKIKTLVKQKWAAFKANNWAELQTFINEYALKIEGARNSDYQVWKRGSADFKTDLNALNTWLQNRSAYMTTIIDAF